ncbi:hypothetical protein DIPPA_19358 [Diplonema papillatum]|nr:hypothetical protein DIPPA_19358 [Diplonema papillatum]
MPAPRHGKAYRELKEATAEVKTKLTGLKRSYEEISSMKDRVNQVTASISAAERDLLTVHSSIEYKIMAHELKVATEYLAKKNQVPKDRFEVMELQRLKQQKTSEGEQEENRIAQEVQKQVLEITRFKDAEFGQKFAEFQARERAFVAERKSLEDTINGLRQEIESQKKLSRAICGGG